MVAPFRLDTLEQADASVRAAKMPRSQRRAERAKERPKDRPKDAPVIPGPAEPLLKDLVPDDPIPDDPILNDPVLAALDVDDVAAVLLEEEFQPDIEQSPETELPPELVSVAEDVELVEVVEVVEVVAVTEVATPLVTRISSSTITTVEGSAPMLPEPRQRSRSRSARSATVHPSRLGHHGHLGRSVVRGRGS